MRCVVIGLGVQGNKRLRCAGADCVGSVDPLNKAADYPAIAEVPLDAYDAALCCIPDAPKIEILNYLLSYGKHVLVEKPLSSPSTAALEALQTVARENGVVCYTAYNHRFEPHFLRMRDLIASGKLGTIYRCRMFYGNGTARLVRNSVWRDVGSGVLHDLGSHLLDTANFWFGELEGNFRLISADCFENKAPDHVVIGSSDSSPKLELEMTLLSWCNQFHCDIIAEHGSAQIESLCKWGPSRFVHRTRVLPSGRPLEEAITVVQDDPTWALEYDWFKQLCETTGQTDLGRDLWINRQLRELEQAALRCIGG